MLSPIQDKKQVSNLMCDLRHNSHNSKDTCTIIILLAQIIPTLTISI